MSNTDARARQVIRQAISDWTRNQPQLGPHEAAGSILSALSDAGIRLAGPGKVVVDRDRFERLQDNRKFLETWIIDWFTESVQFSLRDFPCGIEQMNWERFRDYLRVGLQPGDLEPLEGGE